VLPASPSPILGLSLRCDRRAPRLARRALEEALDTAPVLEDARLVASELVNLAVMNFWCVADDIIRLAAELDEEFLIISVHVPGVAHEAEGELGMRVVQELAHRWGSETHDGHRVWAALPLGTAA
jgi:hypothetical protein